MPEYKIKGKNNEFVIDLPELIDERTKEVIEKTLRKCVKPENQERVMEALNRILSQTNALIDGLKEDENYHEKLEKDIRRFVGIHMRKGFDIGRKTIQPEEIDIVQEALSKQMKYTGKVIKDLPKNLQGFSTGLFTALELGRMAFESGFVLGILLSTEEIDKFYEEEAEDISYIR